MTANFVARAGNYQIRPFDWGKCHRKTVETFTLNEMEKICAEISAAGFRFIDLWIAHAYVLARDKKHIERFHHILEKWKLQLVAAGLGLGGTRTNRKEVQRNFTTLVQLGVPLLVGPMEKDDVAIIAEWCEQYGVRAAIENHPEKTAEEVLEKIGDYGRWIGACVDTGWWATQGADAVRELILLRDHLLHVHLKDVRETTTHHTCALGEGIVNITGVLNVLDKIDYRGYISIEHEPGYVDPMEDVKKSRTLVLDRLRERKEERATKRPVRAAVIGAGKVWNFHAKSLWQIPEAEIVGQCDLNEDKLHKVTSLFGGRPFTAMEQMLDEVKPDAVWICTPQDVRLEPIKECVRRRIPFFCEKPPAFDLKTAGEISKLLRKSNLLHSVGFMWRYAHLTRRAREILGGHKIPVVQSKLTCGLLLNPEAPSWFLLKERSGGPVLDQAIHILDLLRSFLGEVTHVQAFGSNVLKKKSPVQTVEDSVALAFRFESGAVGTHTHSWAVSQYIAEIQFLSPRLALKLDYVANRLEGMVEGAEIDERFRDDPYLTEAKQFIEAVRTNNGASIQSSYFEAVKTLAVALAANRSLDSGLPETV